MAIAFFLERARNNDDGVRVQKEKEHLYYFNPSDLL
jgi:hypothetical protein